MCRVERRRPVSPIPTVMRPSGFWNTRWSPEVRTWRQPAFSSVLIRSRTLTTTDSSYAFPQVAVKHRDADVCVSIDGNSHAISRIRCGHSIERERACVRLASLYEPNAVSNGTISPFEAMQSRNQRQLGNPALRAGKKSNQNRSYLQNSTKSLKQIKTRSFEVRYRSRACKMQLPMHCGLASRHRN